MPEPKRKQKPRGKGRMNIAIKEAVEFAFNKVNGSDGAGLVKLADTHPAVFYALVSRCIPAAVAVSVSHSFDLGEAMQIAADNAKRLNALNTIDITPDPLNTAKPLILKDK